MSASGSEPPAGATLPAMRRALVLTLRVAAALALVVLVWTAIALITVRDELQRAQDALESARDASSTEDARASLVEAETALGAVTGRLGQPGPAVAARVPVIGRTVGAVRRTAAAALSVAEGGRRVLSAVDDGGPLLADGRVDTDRLLVVQQELERAAARTDAPVADLLDQPLGLVPGVVAEPVRRAKRELDEMPRDLASAAAGLRGVRAVLGAEQEQSLLVLVENNAELRGTGGIVTVFARATVRDGRLDVGDFQEVEDVADSAGRARTVPAPADYRALYGRFKADTTLWKNTNMAADVPTSSRVLAEVAALTTGERPDAMLWLDVPAIAAVLRATGPATLPDGGELRAEDVIPRLLSTAYVDAPDTPEGQSRRRAVLRGAADAVIGQLLGGDADPDPQALADELAAMARGRHLALWSGDAATQADLVAGGVAGAVEADGGDISSFAVHNLGGGDADGNKLDYYGRRQTTVRVTVDAGNALVEQEIALRNTAPARGLPVYVAGRVTPGVVNALVTLALPADAGEIGFSRDGSPLSPLPQPEGDHDVVTDVVSIPPGVVVTWRLRYRLPLQDGAYRLALFPQPVAVDSGLSVELGPADGITLAAAAGTELEGGRLALSGPFAETTTLQVEVRRPGWLARWRDAVSRFWNEPVRLP